MRHRIVCWLLFLLMPVGAAAQVASPHAIDVPKWFVETFLDFREDVREAAAQGKRLLLYFGQDGCPYCKALMQTNFSQRSIAQKTQRHFIPMALNMWGDRETTWLDGAKQSEKELARRLKVQFTPTVLFLDETGRVVARINGYFPPGRFEAVLDYVAGRLENKLALADHLKAAVREEASATLHDQPFFLKPPYVLRRGPGARPLVVLFETPYCSGCDELHRSGFRNPEVQRQLKRYDVVRLSLADRAEVITPGGEATTGEAWARALNVVYTPSMVLFDGAAEVFRTEAYVREFHLSGALEYVASGAHRAEPSFQRYLQTRAEAQRKKGVRVELW